MDKLTQADATSHDIVADNIDKLKTIFPEAFTEGKIDFDVLKETLGEYRETREERYNFSWAGKSKARRLAQTPATGTLRPCPEESVDWDTTENLFIEGDNLEVLKLLQKSYQGKVKMIYIDPPYNTGKDFVYPDKYADNLKGYLEFTKQVDGEGNKLSSNAETGGRYHSNWLNMMLPRLTLAKNLLKDDGVMFISIDDSEAANLVKLGDEVFGEENRISLICHKSRASVSNDKIISPNHNYILLYAKNERTIFNLRSKFGLPPELDGFDEEDENGQFKFVPVDGPGGAAKGNPHYTFLGVTGYWRFSEETMKEKYDAGLVQKVGNGLQQKYYLEDAKKTRKTTTTWWDEKLYTSTASARLKQLMDGAPFNNPKHIDLIRKMIELWCRNDGDIVVDFFAGSGTTAHSCLEQAVTNDQDIRYIVVQLPEPLATEASQKVAAEYCDRIGKPRNIAELSKERIRRTAAKIKDEHPDYKGDLGFKVFKLDSSNIEAWDSNDENLEDSVLKAANVLKDGRGELDIVYELFLKYGLDLSYSVNTHEVAGKQVYEIGAGSLFICLEDHITTDFVEALIKLYKSFDDEAAPRVVFKDSGFKTDAAKKDAESTLKDAGILDVKCL